MPNHVTINMTVTGKKELVQTFIDQHITLNAEEDNRKFEGMETLLDFNTIIPMPEEVGDGWYEWRNLHWGTKWNAYDQWHNIDMGDYHDQSIQVNFQTAWGLPTPIFEQLMVLHPELSFEIECCEEGGFFAGEISYKGGEVTDGIVGEDGWDEWAAKMYDYPLGDDGKIDWESME